MTDTESVRSTRSAKPTQTSSCTLSHDQAARSAKSIPRTWRPTTRPPGPSTASTTNRPMPSAPLAGPYLRCAISLAASLATRGHGFGGRTSHNRQPAAAPRYPSSCSRPPVFSGLYAPSTITRNPGHGRAASPGCSAGPRLPSPPPMPTARPSAAANMLWSLPAAVATNFTLLTAAICTGTLISSIWGPSCPCSVAPSPNRKRFHLMTQPDCRYHRLQSHESVWAAKLRPLVESRSYLPEARRGRVVPCRLAPKYRPGLSPSWPCYARSHTRRSSPQCL
jgi:hypothetical protein